MSKTGVKKAAPKKVAVVKGCVGYFYGGVLKVGAAWVFSSESEDPQSVYDEARTYLGRYTTCKYVVCENASDVFEKLKEEINDAHDFGSVYLIHSSTLFDKLKEVSGVDRCKNLKEKPEKEEPEEGAAKAPAKKAAPAKAAATPAKTPAKAAAPAKGGKKAAAVEEEVEVEDVEVEVEDDAEDVEDVEEDGEDAEDGEEEDGEEEDGEEEDAEPEPEPPKKAAGKGKAAAPVAAPTKAPAKGKVAAPAPAKTPAKAPPKKK
jgi:hypothetical protein